MRTLLLLSLLPLCFSFSYLPERIVTPLVEIFGKERKLPDGVQLHITTISESGTLKRGGGRQIFSTEEVQKMRERSSAVYRMQSRSWFGTAFHIGNNLVLTNLHVLDRESKNKTSCANFALLSRDEDDEFACKKVHHCDATLDLCLIEMKPIKKKHGCIFCRKEIEYVHLASGPSLKIRAGLSPEELDSESIILSAIGNTKGYGIHFSQGQGVRAAGQTLHFWAPLTGGNSGGPLLNDAGEVVGLVRAETVNKIDHDPSRVFNIAVRSDILVAHLREALEEDPETLLKFNDSVIE